MLWSQERADASAFETAPAGTIAGSLFEGASSLYGNLLLAAAYVMIGGLVLRCITRSSDVGQSQS
jgi:hypothetical protein